MLTAFDKSVTRGFSIAECSHITDTKASPYVRENARDSKNRRPHNAGMEEKPPHYLRQWREYRRMSVRELAKAVGTSPSTISDLELFNLQLSPKWLRRLAPVLDTQQGYILDYDPEDVPADIFDLWTHIAEKDRDQAARILRTFSKTGTHD